MIERPHEVSGPVSERDRTGERDREDAEKFRALRDAARIRLMGYAGNLKPGDVSSNPPGVVHAGFEFWSHNPYPDLAHEIALENRTHAETFDLFVAKMVEARKARK